MNRINPNIMNERWVPCCCCCCAVSVRDIHSTDFYYFIVLEFLVAFFFIANNERKYTTHFSSAFLSPLLLPSSVLPPQLTRYKMCSIKPKWFFFNTLAQSLLRGRPEPVDVHGKDWMRQKRDAAHGMYEGWISLRSVSSPTQCLLHVQTQSTQYADTYSWCAGVLILYWHAINHIKTINLGSSKRSRLIIEEAVNHQSWISQGNDSVSTVSISL